MVFFSIRSVCDTLDFDAQHADVIDWHVTPYASLYLPTNVTSLSSSNSDKLLQRQSESAFTMRVVPGLSRGSHPRMILVERL